MTAPASDTTDPLATTATTNANHLIPRMTIAPKVLKTGCWTGSAADAVVWRNPPWEPGQDGSPGMRQSQYRC